MNREEKKALLEKRMEALRTEHERRIAAIRARTEARRAGHMRKLEAVYAGILERKREKYCREADKYTVKTEPVREDLNPAMQTMTANVPTIHFPEDDPKYNSARKNRYV